MTEKVEINGPNAHPLYVYLRSKSELYDKKTKTSRVIPWNFSKFIVDQKGKVIKFFPPEEKMENVA